MAIAEYHQHNEPLIKQSLCLLDWININELNWSGLSSNPDAVYLLEQFSDKIDWSELSKNPNAIHLLVPSGANLKTPGVLRFTHRL
jgi:hypothetical protein